MDRVITGILRILMMAAFVAAVQEVHWVVVLSLFATGFLGTIVFGCVQASVTDDRYQLAVHRVVGCPLNEVPRSGSALMSLGALALFAGLAGLSIASDNPVWAIGGFFVVAVVGTMAAMRSYAIRTAQWRYFAGQLELEFAEGRLFSSRDNAEIQGRVDDRAISFSTAWQDRPGDTDRRRSRSEVLTARIDIDDPDLSFCVDDVQPDDNRLAEIPALSADQDLRELLSYALLKRLAAHDKQLSIHASRVPETAVELQFYLKLLCDTAKAIERSPTSQLS